MKDREELTNYLVSSNESMKTCTINLNRHYNVVQESNNFVMKKSGMDMIECIRQKFNGDIGPIRCSFDKSILEDKPEEVVFILRQLLQLEEEEALE
jgi:hypothetical protein